MGQVEQALAIAIQANVPGALEGPPGTGKSKRVEAIGRALAKAGLFDANVGVDGTVTWIASQNDPVDVGGVGIPERNAEGRVVNVARLPASPELILAMRHGVLLFLDEISQCDPTMQAPIMSAIQERRIGVNPFHEKTRIAFAYNPVELAAAGRLFAAPFANRICFLKDQPDYDAWSQGMMFGWESAELGISLLPKDWEDRIPEVNALAVGFLNAADGRKHWNDCPKADEVKASGPWPSSRSWTNAMRLYAAALASGAPKAVQMDLVGGCVGDAVVTKFFAYIEALDLPDPEVWLKDPDKVVVPDRGDRAYAAANGVVLAVKRQSTVARWTAAWKVLVRYLPAGKGDMAARAAEGLFREDVKPAGAKKVPEMTQFFPMLDKAGFFKGVRI